MEIGKYNREKIRTTFTPITPVQDQKISNNQEPANRLEAPDRRDLHRRRQGISPCDHFTAAEGVPESH